MPIYGMVITPAEILTTLTNDINANTLNPFVEPVLKTDSVWITQERPLIPNTLLADGEAQNYRHIYYKNLCSANTTAGYTNMTQVTFTRHTGMITGYQYGLPTISKNLRKK